MNFKKDDSLEKLLRLADKVGGYRYHRLTSQDLEKYHEFDHWRYVNGNHDFGTTEESRQWVRENSGRQCPVCGDYFNQFKNRSIDHKLPRSQYPWLSLDYRNLWVICYPCNQEKGEMHWYEYERYTFAHYRDRYSDVVAARPRELLKTLRL